MEPEFQLSHLCTTHRVKRQLCSPICAKLHSPQARDLQTGNQAECNYMTQRTENVIFDIFGQAHVTHVAIVARNMQQQELNWRFLKVEVPPNHPS